MYLSDYDIKREIEKGNVSLDPFTEEHLTPNGYDLSVLIYDKLKNDFVELDKYVLNPNEGVQIKSIENIHLGNGFIGFMYLRSRYSRNGVYGSFAVIDSGFNGKIIAYIKNESDKPIEILPKDGVVHLVIAKLKTKSEHPYGSTEKSHFQNQF
jgi:dCTP deaminase